MEETCRRSAPHVCVCVRARVLARQLTLRIFPNPVTHNVIRGEKVRACVRARVRLARVFARMIICIAQHAGA